MWPMVSFCRSPTYQLSKHLTSILKPLTDESRHKLQSIGNFIGAIQAIQIPEDHKLVSFDVKSLAPVYHFNLLLTVLRPPSTNHPTNHHYPQTILWTYCNFVWPQLTFSTTVNRLQGTTRNSYGLPCFHCCGWNSHAKHRGTGPSNLQWNTPSLATLRWWYDHCCTQKQNRWIPRTLEQTE